MKPPIYPACRRTPCVTTAADVLSLRGIRAAALGGGSRR